MWVNIWDPVLYARSRTRMNEDQMDTKRKLIIYHMLYVCISLFKNYYSFSNIIWPIYSKVLFVEQPLKFNTLKHASVLCMLKPNLHLTCLFFYFSNHHPSVCLVLFCRISLFSISEPLFFSTSSLFIFSSHVVESSGGFGNIIWIKVDRESVSEWKDVKGDKGQK